MSRLYTTLNINRAYELLSKVKYILARFPVKMSHSIIRYWILRM